MIGRVRSTTVATVVVVVCALGVLLGACGASTPSNADLTKAFVASGYSRSEARCLADAYAKVLDDRELRAVATRGAAGVPAGKANELSQALGACTTTGPSASTTIPPAGPSAGTVPPTSAPGTSPTSGG